MTSAGPGRRKPRRRTGARVPGRRGGGGWCPGLVRATTPSPRHASKMSPRVSTALATSSRPFLNRPVTRTADGLPSGVPVARPEVPARWAVPGGNATPRRPGPTRRFPTLEFFGRAFMNPVRASKKPYSWIQIFVILSVGWSDDRVAPLALSDPVPAPSLAFPARRASLSPPFSSTRKAPRGSPPSLRSSILSKKLYVGNLTYNVNESDLEALFTPFGTVQSTRSSSTATPTARRGSGSWRWTPTPRPRRPSRGSTPVTTTAGT